MAPSPEEIQREIETTRAELAATVEQIADKVSPKKVAARSATAAKDKAVETGTKAKDAAESVFAPVSETAATPVPIAQRMKWERVGAAVAGVALIVVAIVRIKTRTKTTPAQKAVAKLEKRAGAVADKQLKQVKRANKKVKNTVSGS